MTECGRGAPPPHVAQTSGTIVTSVSAPVRIVRDRWGVPHVDAQSADDLFFAQGFVQAQDRLFQMDLWRRAAQGRLAEILGPNFVERDGMTRRMQYVGDLDAEWASYGDDVKRIASAFVRGINAWVEVAQTRPTEEFLLAGWRPEYWSVLDLLNRTDAFVASGDAVDEVARRNLSLVVADAIRRVGTRPFLAGSKTLPWAVLDNPSTRYLVHLHAPGWNVIGVTAPWRPGVAVGHNDRLSWESQPVDLDTQDIYAESADSPVRIVKDSIRVKGRPSMFDFNREFTAHGVIVAADREQRVVYALRWSGFEPGGAAELGVLALDRAETPEAFRDALTRWKMPARRMTYSAKDAAQEFQDAGLVPIRRGNEWVGWKTLDDLPHGAVRSQPRATSDEPRATRQAPIVFAHVLATTNDLRKRFNIGPLTPTRPPAPMQIVPGQSESPASAHFSDLARLWIAGKAMSLLFSDEEIRANAEATLTLVPKK